MQQHFSGYRIPFVFEETARCDVLAHRGYYERESRVNTRGCVAIWSNCLGSISLIIGAHHELSSSSSLLTRSYQFYIVWGLCRLTSSIWECK